RALIGEVLISAEGSQHVRRTHSGNTAVVAVLGWTCRVVGRQIVERRGDSRRIKVIPKRDALSPEQCLAADGFRCGVEGGDLLVRMPMNEVKDPMRARPSAVNEIGPGNRALRRNARAQGTEPAGCA